MQRELLENFVSGHASLFERERVVKWIDESPENLAEYMALCRLHDILIWREQEIVQMASERSNKTLFASLWRKRSTYISVAAVLVIGFFAFYMPSIKEKLTPVQYAIIEVPAGQRTHIKLVDGTSIWLNSNTKFGLPNNFSASNRNCTIDGEGFFEVKKDTKHPFVVSTSRYELNVTGTSFNVLAFSNSDVFETSLLTGSMTVASKVDANKKYALKPDQTIFESQNALYTKEIDEDSLLLWKDGIYMFNDQDFDNIFKMLEKYYDVKIEVKNPKVLLYRCTGKFRQKEHISHIMKVLQKDNPFSFKMDDENGVITVF